MPADVSKKPLVCSVGDLVTDVVVHLDSDPQRGTDTPVRVHRVRGGSAANVCAGAVAAGGRGRFVGQVGDDHEGEVLAASLEEHGVDTRLAVHGTTGTIVVLVDTSGERSFLTDRGTAVHFSHVAPDVLDDVDVLHVPLYSLLTGALAESTHQLIGEALDRSIPVTISTSSVSALREFGRKEFLSLVKNVEPSLVFANLPEAKYALQGHPWFVGAGATVVSAGSRAARFTKPDGSDHRREPGPVDALDTTGAGDAFTAGFLVAWCRGGTPQDWLDAGHRLAGSSLSRPGAALSPATDDKGSSDKGAAKT